MSNHPIIRMTARLAFAAAGFSLATGGVRADYVYDPGDFATEVVQYTEGGGVPTDFVSGDPFNDSTTALGRPTVDTTGDGWDIPVGDAVPVVAVWAALRSFEMVTVGHDGYLVLGFDHPIVNHPQNPYGIDFVVFGNAFQIIDWQNPWTNGDPNATVVQDGNGAVEPGTVSVSADGDTWYTFNTNGPFADEFAPTLGRVYDDEHPDPSLGAWNLWWGAATDPTIPLDPRLRWSDLHWKSVAQIAQLYENSAGGTGFDLEWLGVPGLNAIQYVRIAGPPSGGTPEVDAVSDVYPCLGDLDRDGDVDLADFAAFQACFTGSDQGPRPRGCFCADFDANLSAADLDVDLNDYATFESFLTGPNLAP